MIQDSLEESKSPPLWQTKWGEFIVEDNLEKSKDDDNKTVTFDIAVNGGMDSNII